MEDFKDELEVEGINSQGYGSIPKKIMKDQNLSIHAKAIYAYFCSYAGSGTKAFPTISKITYDLKISKDTFYKNRKLLEQFGYIKVRQERKNGVFSKNIYTLCEFPVSEETEPSTTSPCTVSPETVEPVTTEAVSGRLETNNNSIYNNNNINNNSSNKNRQTDRQKYKKESQPKILDDMVKPSNKKSIDNYNMQMSLIQENIGYFNYLEELAYFTAIDDKAGIRQATEKLAMIDEFINIMLDTIFSKGDMKIGSEVKSSEIVAGVFKKANHSQIELAYNRFMGVDIKITNKKNFIRSILYNSCLECSSDMTNFVNSMYGDK